MAKDSLRDMMKFQNVPAQNIPEYETRNCKRLSYILPEYRAHYMQQNRDNFLYRLDPVKFTTCRKCTETNGTCYLSKYSPAAGSAMQQHKS